MNRILLLKNNTNDDVVDYLINCFKFDNKDITINSINDSLSKESLNTFDIVLYCASFSNEIDLELDNKVFESFLNKINNCKNISQFVFLSSLRVYGKKEKVNKSITENPKSKYALNLLQQEQMIKSLLNCKVSILRLPLVFGSTIESEYYGEIKRIAKKFFVPKIKNKVSLLHIDNLYSYLYTICEKSLKGLYLLSDKEVYSILDICNYINRAHKSKARLSNIATFFYKLSSLFSAKKRRILKSSYISPINDNELFAVYNNHDAIFLTEGYPDTIKQCQELKDGLVSFITPLYNSEKYIAETIESVLKQTYTNFEMIIVDDGSGDNSCKIVEDFAKKDSRIKLYKSEKNGGSSKARNEAIRHSSGEYICFLDSDDLYESNYLEEQIKFMKVHNVLATYSNYTMFSANGAWQFNASKKVTYYSQNYKRNLSALATIYNRKQLGVIYMREDILKAEDYIYWFELLEIVKVIYGNNQFLAHYRMTPNSKSRNKKKLIKFMWNVFYKYEKHGVVTSLFYLFIWGFSGLRKYHKVK